MNVRFFCLFVFRATEPNSGCEGLSYAFCFRHKESVGSMGNLGEYSKRLVTVQVSSCRGRTLLGI